jgi:hypothetical protein
VLTAPPGEQSKAVARSTSARTRMLGTKLCAEATARAVAQSKCLEERERVGDGSLHGSTSLPRAVSAEMTPAQIVAAVRGRACAPQPPSVRLDPAVRFRGLWADDELVR